MKTRKPIAKKSKSDLSKLKDALDEIFSKFIRHRDANENGICKCISCGQFGHIKTMDCGHYISRDILPLRWDERNCHAQCKHCNITLKGNYPAYALSLKRKLGPDIEEQLEVKRHNTMKLMRFEYELLIAEYKQKFEKVRKY